MDGGSIITARSSSLSSLLSTSSGREDVSPTRTASPNKAEHEERFILRALNDGQSSSGTAHT